MSGKTPQGWPYPTGTDYLVDGDNAIKAIADRLDSQRCFAVFNIASFSLPSGGFGIPQQVTLDATKSTPNATAITAGSSPNYGLILPWGGEWMVHATFTTSTGLSGRSFIDTYMGSNFNSRYAWGTPVENRQSGTLLAYVLAGQQLYWNVYQGTGAGITATAVVTLSYQGRLTF